MQPPFALRKQRTRQHVIADQSVNHVERHILDEGHCIHRLTPDYGYDVILMTFDGDGYVEPGLLFIQVKASESLKRSGQNVVYDLDIRDYNLWKVERNPVILILFDASERRAYWIHIQAYLAENEKRSPRTTSKTIRISIGRDRVFHRKAVAKLRSIKNKTALPLFGGMDHA